LFRGDRHLNEPLDLVNDAIDLSENKKRDLNNIHWLGEGWVAEETLAIAIYCALRYQDDFSNNRDHGSWGQLSANDNDLYRLIRTFSPD